MKAESPHPNSRVMVNGDMEGNIIVGDDNRIIIPPKKDSKKRSLQFLVTIFLGTILPICACLITIIAYVSRHYYEGVWTTGTVEIVSTAIALFGITILGVILLITGVGQFGSAAFTQASNVDWAKWLRYSWKLMKDGIEYAKAHPNWLVTGKTFLKSIGTSSGWQELELKERSIAVLLSLFVPGLGVAYRGHRWLGISLFVLTLIGYLAEIIPGILLHLVIIVLSGIFEKPRVTFPQIQEFKDSDLKQNLSKTVKYLQDVESVDVGLFYLGKLFEAELLAFLNGGMSRSV